jgi:hypothetical protein
MVPTRGGAGRTQESSRRSAKDGGLVGTESFIRKPFVPGFFRRRLILWTSAARLCRSSGCDPPPACVVSISPRPQARLECYMVGRLSTSALPKRSFQDVRRLLQRLPPTQIRPYPLRGQTTLDTHVRPVDMRVYGEYPALKRNIGQAEREILTLAYI